MKKISLIYLAKTLLPLYCMYMVTGIYLRSAYDADNKLLNTVKIDCYKLVKEATLCPLQYMKDVM